MKKPNPRTLDVVATRYITPNMCRITLGGAGLMGFPDDQDSAYIKLLFPSDNEDAQKLDSVQHPENTQKSERVSKPLMRTYTVSVQRDNEIDVDFAMHNAKGPASMWAQHAKVGDQILISGPGPKKLINQDADWFLLVGDMTALPAISVNLAQLPADARGYAVLEITDEVDRQVLKKPENVEIYWVINASPNTDSSPLLDHVQQLEWLQGQPAVWTACEFHSMRALRHYFKVERLVPKTHLYISSYWKIDSNEDQHKIIKREDAQEAD